MLDPSKLEPSRTCVQLPPAPDALHRFRHIFEFHHLTFQHGSDNALVYILFWLKLNTGALVFTLLVFPTISLSTPGNHDKALAHLRSRKKEVTTVLDHLATSHAGAGEAAQAHAATSQAPHATSRGSRDPPASSGGLLALQRLSGAASAGAPEGTPLSLPVTTTHLQLGRSLQQYPQLQGSLPHGISGSGLPAGGQSATGGPRVCTPMPLQFASWGAVHPSSLHPQQHVGPAVSTGGAGQLYAQRAQHVPSLQQIRERHYPQLASGARSSGGYATGDVAGLSLGNQADALMLQHAQHTQRRGNISMPPGGGTLVAREGEGWAGHASDSHSPEVTRTRSREGQNMLGESRQLGTHGGYSASRFATQQQEQPPQNVPGRPWQQSEQHLHPFERPPGAINSPRRKVQRQSSQASGQHTPPSPHTGSLATGSMGSLGDLLRQGVPQRGFQSMASMHGVPWPLQPSGSPQYGSMHTLVQDADAHGSFPNLPEPSVSLPGSGLWQPAELRTRPQHMGSDLQIALHGQQTHMPEQSQPPAAVPGSPSTLFQGKRLRASDFPGSHLSPSEELMRRLEAARQSSAQHPTQPPPSQHAFSPPRSRTFVQPEAALNLLTHPSSTFLATPAYGRSATSLQIPPRPPSEPEHHTHLSSHSQKLSSDDLLSWSRQAAAAAAAGLPEPHYPPNADIPQEVREWHDSQTRPLPAVVRWALTNMQGLSMQPSSSGASAHPPQSYAGAPETFAPDYQRFLRALDRAIREADARACSGIPSIALHELFALPLRLPIVMFPSTQKFGGIGVSGLSGDGDGVAAADGVAGGSSDSVGGGTLPPLHASESGTAEASPTTQTLAAPQPPTPPPAPSAALGSAGAPSCYADAPAAPTTALSPTAAARPDLITSRLTIDDGESYPVTPENLGSILPALPAWVEDSTVLELALILGLRYCKYPVDSIVEPTAAAAAVITSIPDPTPYAPVASPHRQRFSTGGDAAPPTVAAHAQAPVSQNPHHLQQLLAAALSAGAAPGTASGSAPSLIKQLAHALQAAPVSSAPPMRSTTTLAQLMSVGGVATGGHGTGTIPHSEREGSGRSRMALATGAAVGAAGPATSSGMERMHEALLPANQSPEYLQQLLLAGLAQGGTAPARSRAAGPQIPAEVAPGRLPLSVTELQQAQLSRYLQAGGVPTGALAAQQQTQVQPQVQPGTTSSERLVCNLAASLLAARAGMAPIGGPSAAQLSGQLPRTQGSVQHAAPRGAAVPQMQQAQQSSAVNLLTMLAQGAVEGGALRAAALPMPVPGAAAGNSGAPQPIMQERRRELAEAGPGQGSQQQSVSPAGGRARQSRGPRGSGRSLPPLHHTQLSGPTTSDSAPHLPSPAAAAGMAAAVAAAHVAAAAAPQMSSGHRSDSAAAHTASGPATTESPTTVSTPAAAQHVSMSPFESEVQQQQQQHHQQQLCAGQVAGGVAALTDTELVQNPTAAAGTTREASTIPVSTGAARTFRSASEPSRQEPEESGGDQ